MISCLDLTPEYLYVKINILLISNVQLALNHKIVFIFYSPFKIQSHIILLWLFPKLTFSLQKFLIAFFHLYISEWVSLRSLTKELSWYKMSHAFRANKQGTKITMTTVMWKTQVERTLHLPSNLYVFMQHKLTTWETIRGKIFNR